MGYTHYYRLNPHGNQQRYEQAKADMRKIIERNPVKLGDGSGDNPIHPDNYTNEIWLNGLGDDAHETFSLPDKLTSLINTMGYNPNEKMVFNFTKTNRKPYDVVVTACLTILKFYLRSDAEISSDGGEDGFVEGMALAEHILGRPFPNPSHDVEASIDYIKER